MYDSTNYTIADYGIDDAKPHFKYSGSDNAGEVAWLYPSSVHPVAQKKPNEFGLYDMNGNVSEFALLYGSTYGIMGGDFATDASNVTWYYRSATKVGTGSASTGFGYRLYMRY